MALCLYTSLLAMAQQPVFKEDFEQVQNGETVTGISGKALNLGADAGKRQVVLSKHQLTGNESGFSLTIWVRAAQQSTEPYDILSAFHKHDTAYSGWKIGVTAKGGWEFQIIQQNQLKYIYSATAPRQNVRDGNWHLLAISYDGIANELRFYYDGNIMAIYRADGINGFYAPQDMMIGGSIDSEYYFKKLGWKTYWDSFNGQIDDITIYGNSITANKIAAYYSDVSGKKPAPPAVDFMPDIFSVTAFNIFHGAHEFGKETGKNNLVTMLRNINSDAYLLIETYGSGAEIADALGYHLYLISSNLSIISRYPFVETYRLTSSFNAGAAQVRLSNGKKVNLACVWLNYLPARNIGEGEGWSKEKYLVEENKTRGEDIRIILNDIKPLLSKKDSIPLIVAGDFNSGSHLDWTEHTKAVHNGYTMPWPVSIAMNKAGFKDSFREIHPDALAIPGRTFYDTDRIDFIYYQGKKMVALDSEIIGSHPIVFPSDHSLVHTIFQLRW